MQGGFPSYIGVKMISGFKKKSIVKFKRNSPGVVSSIQSPGLPNIEYKKN